MKRVREVPSARKTESGVAVVEFAVLLPLLTFLLLAIFDLGMVLREYAILQNATREGARLSIHPVVQGQTTEGPTPDAVRTRVLEYMAAEGITIGLGDVTVTQTESVQVPGGVSLHSTRVSVTYTRALVIAGGGILPAGQLTLSASSVFANLY